MAKPEKDQTKLIQWGYLLAITTGVFGIIIGSSLLKSKKTLPDGQKVYTYSENNRAHGKNILLLGSIILGIVILTRILG